MLDLRCYFVTGTAEPAEIIRVAGQAAAGGAGVVQVRSKPISARELSELTIAVAREVARINSATKVLVDDRVDVAAALMPDHHVHWVHIGQEDLHPRLARKVLGPKAIIGLTTGTMELVHEANEYADVIDYVGCGPFRRTPTKDSGREPIGVAGYPALAGASRLPMVAIGDVQAHDVAALATTGVAGVALVREFMHHPDPTALARQILRDMSAGAASLSGGKEHQ